MRSGGTLPSPPLVATLRSAWHCDMNMNLYVYVCRCGKQVLESVNATY